MTGPEFNPADEEPTSYVVASKTFESDLTRPISLELPKRSEPLHVTGTLPYSWELVYIREAGEPDLDPPLTVRVWPILSPGHIPAGALRRLNVTDRAWSIVGYQPAIVWFVSP